MNKKSLVLSALLLIGLLTPQEAKPNDELRFFLFPIGIMLSARTLSQVFRPTSLSNFIKSSEQIASYTAHIKTSQRNNSERSILVEKTICTKNPYALIENIKEIALPYEKKRLIRIDVTFSIECTNGKKYSLRTIRLRNYSISRLARAARLAIIVRDQYMTYNTKMIALTGLVWGYILLPLLVEAYIWLHHIKYAYWDWCVLRNLELWLNRRS